MRLILRMGLLGFLRGEPMLFLLSLVGEGGAGFPIWKKKFTLLLMWGETYTCGKLNTQGHFVRKRINTHSKKQTKNLIIILIA